MSYGQLKKDCYLQEAEPKTVTKVKDANKESSSGAAEVLMET